MNTVVGLFTAQLDNKAWVTYSVFVTHGDFMEKSSILKARVTDTLHGEFISICDAVGRTPTSVLRELIDRHVAANRNLLEDEVKISLVRPRDYDYGAWHARISLGASAAMEFKGAPIPFRIPQLPARRIHPDRGYCVAASDWDGNGPGLDGIFVDGIWEGDIYSNGIHEDENPTSIETVKSALKASVTERISILSVSIDY